jgi:predicted nucleic acid-binding protein
MKVVADASVCVKWFFPDSPKEQHSEQAMYLLKQVAGNQIVLCQPSHWLAEVVAVITRIQPDIAELAIDYLTAMELDILQTPETLKIASRLSFQLSHHLFDTLYHALAIETDGVFITADKKYFNKAQSFGHIQLLATYR